MLNLHTQRDFRGADEKVFVAAARQNGKTARKSVVEEAGGTGLP
jgi:hypothetical protein